MEPVATFGFVLIALLGFLVGTVLDGVVTRVPAGAPVMLALRPQCVCGVPRRGWDALPVLWLFRRDRACPSCGARSSGTRLVLEVLCGGTFLTFALVLGASWELPAYLYLAAVGLALAAIDMRTRRLPNALVVPAYPIFGGLLLMPTLAEGLWSSYARAALGGLALFAIYLLLALISPSGMGLGDVKLAGVVGMALAWFAWASWVLGSVLAFFLAAIVGIGLLVTRRAGRHTAVPFGPFMVAGAILGVLAVPVMSALALSALG